MTRKINRAGLDLIKGAERLVLFAYDDGAYPPKPFRSGNPKGTLTIGYGHTQGVRPAQTITEAEADRLLWADLAAAEQAVASKVKVPLSVNQFSALVSFVFNAGIESFASSTLLRRLNAGDYDAVARELPRWNKTAIERNGKKVKVVSTGLVNRREAEKTLWLSGSHDVQITRVATHKTAGEQNFAERSPVICDIRMIQRQLFCRGYTEVGFIDGDWGADSAKALKAFEIENGLQGDGILDDVTVRILFANKAKRNVSATRATMTGADLKAAGSKVIQNLDYGKAGAAVITAGGALAGSAEVSGIAGPPIPLTDPASAIEQGRSLIEQGSDAVSMAFQLQDLWQMLVNNLWVLMVLSGIALFFVLNKLYRRYEEGVRAGEYRPLLELPERDEQTAEPSP
ncbi:GH24 family phage-related lysozyme (muramidase) [Rhodoligotrophos appendicifer]|uniref:glycoside hydrolase family protein n=1 Tax=Rhodoligotrophos appendicifer TaxID=987056 RepID=UPI001184926A|nr:glycoside hydrolase family protein [Rhodoligotrophos appendicifer]